MNKPKITQPLVKNSLSAPQQSKKRTKKNSLTLWSSRYDELKLYKIKYGNCNVPRHWPQNPSLGQWVQSQRNHYRYWKRGTGKTSMTQERFDALESLGFKWVLQSHSVSKAWSERLEELKNYKKTYGHCDIPHRWPPNLSLGQWVSTQRAEYAKWKVDKHSTMTEGRKNALEAIGFNWCLRRRPARRVCDEESNRKKQEKSPSNLSEKICKGNIPDKIASQEPMKCLYTPTISIPNVTSYNYKATNFENHPDALFPDMFATIENGNDNPYSLICNDTDPSFESESFLPELKLQNEETSALNISDFNKQGPSFSIYLSDISDEDFDFEDLSKVSFGEDFFQTLDHAV